jgi:hypothetical protein
VLRPLILSVLLAWCCRAACAAEPLEFALEGGSANVLPSSHIQLRSPPDEYRAIVYPALWVKKEFLLMMFGGRREVGDIVMECGAENRGGKTLSIDLDLRCEQFDKVDGVAAVIEVPRSKVAQGSFTVDEAPAAAFKQPANAPPRLFTGRAHSVVVRFNDGTRLHLARSPGGLTVIQDAARYKRDAYQIQFYAEPSRGQPRSRRLLSLTLGFVEADLAPQILSLQANRREVPRYGIFELDARVRASFDNPFDPDDVLVEASVVAPSGEVQQVRGFCAQPLERAEGKQELRPAGPPQWKVRFAPEETGAYRYQLCVATQHGDAWSEAGSFDCVPSQSSGYIGVAQGNRRRFAFANGAPYTPIGMNVAWASAQQPFETYFDALQKAGANYARVWLCSWDLAFEGTRLDDYQLDIAQRLDEVVAAAAARGIYVQLCIDNFLDYTDAAKSRRVPYWQRNGGPCLNIRDFFGKPEAAACYQHKLDYLAARYGAFTSLFAWELWNEMDLLTGDSKPKYMIDWSSQMADHLRASDLGRHPVSTSLGRREPWPGFWTSSGLDFAQLHAYIYQPDFIDDGAELDSVELIFQRLGELGPLDMPVLVSEFGFMGEQDFNPLNERDTEGVHLHDALWAAALGGAAGGVMPWWWDNYVHPTNQYRHFAALAGFFSGLDLTGPGWHAATAHLDDRGPVRVIGLKTDSAAVLWIQRRGNSWYERVIEQSEPRLLRNVGVRVPNLLDGLYRAEWFDTFTGQAIGSTQAQVANGILELKVPAAATDVAVKIRRGEAGR